jgi:hypothetical protein
VVWPSCPSVWWPPWSNMRSNRPIETFWSHPSVEFLGAL